MRCWCPSSDNQLVAEFCSLRVGSKGKPPVDFEACLRHGSLSLVYIILALILGAYQLQPRRPSRRYYHRGYHVALWIGAAFNAILTLTAMIHGLQRSMPLSLLVQESFCFIMWTFLSGVVYRNIRRQESVLTLDLRFVSVVLSILTVVKLVPVALEADRLYNPAFWLYQWCAIAAIPVVLAMAVHWPHDKGEAPHFKKEHTIGLGPENPFRYSALGSKIWYTWYTKLLKAGYKRQLVADDVFELEDGMYVDELRQKFENEWQKEMHRSKGKVSLARVLWCCFYKNILHAVLLKATYDAISFAPPLLLNELLKWVQANQNFEDTPRCHGYVIASLMVLAVTMQPILENSYFYVVYRTGLRSRSCLVDAVQRKALVITPAAREQIGTGTIINHMTKDAEMFERVYNSINYLWSAPVRIIVALCLLNKLVGYAAFIGFLTIVLLFPFQGFVSKLVGVYRKASFKLNDQRVNAMSELITGIRIVKFYGWEESSLLRIFAIRVQELKKLLRLAYCSAVNIVLFNINPILIAVVVFSVHARYGNLTANIAFTALSLLDIVRFPMMMLPGSITVVIEARIALQRLGRYLAAEEIPKVSTKGLANGSICVEGVSVGGNRPSEYRIKGVTISITPGQLVAIVGRTGCGKSTLLEAIVGDTVISEGSVTVDGAVSYVSQQAWIMNETVQENILFGEALNPKKLHNALRVCQLHKDAASWPGGLQQEIGERGLNLSGGQKQRISLARALYSESDIVLLDDPLSALDAKVGHDVFTKCIYGALKGRTRLFVTSQMHFLECVDWVIFMEDGQVKAQGKYADLCAQSPSFAAFTQADDRKEKSKDSAGSESPCKGESLDQQENSPPETPISEKGRQIDEEYRKSGTSFTWEYLKAYCRASGGLWVLAVAISFFGLRQALNVLASWWLSRWAGNAYDFRTRIWVTGYGLLGLAQALVEFFMAIFIASRGINAAKNIHDGMLNNLIRLPMLFFDRNPSGRILNRVTKDQANMDDGLTWQLNVTMKCIFGVLGTIAAITFVSPLFLLVAMPVVFAFYWIQVFYRSSVRELKRLESTTRSPIYSVFGETLSGVSLIRAYGKQNYRTNRLATLLNHNQKFILANMTANRWLNMRLEGLGAIVILATSFFAVANYERIGAELIGFALNYAFTITANMSIVILVYSEAEKGFTSVERVLEYANMRPEKRKGSLYMRDQIWPDKGKIEYRGVTVAYKDDLPPVLKNISFTILPGQKVGIVGRTGSGKSSMMLSLFRMMDLREGQICIDGVDISQVDLEKVRTSIAIIPQDPIVFNGTIRSNLDPFNLFTDNEINVALSRANLQEMHIDDNISEGGGNLSVGQKQLLCLARALLLKTKILVLDEATASVDPHTDRIIQETIRRELGKRTLLIIAHRLHTVIDADVILLLDNGYLVDHGRPFDLYEKTYTDGRPNLFRELVDQYGDDANALIETMRRQSAKQLEDSS